MKDIRHVVKVLQGDTFMVTEQDGNATQAGPYGLFHRDTRFLSHWVLSIDGRDWSVLTAHNLDYFAASFYLTRPTQSEKARALTLVRRRYIAQGMHEDLEIENHGLKEARLQVQMAYRVDFQSLFEVKGSSVPRQRTITCEVGEGRITFAYQREDFERRTVIELSAHPAVTAEHATWQVTVPPGGRWRACVAVAMETEVGKLQVHGMPCDGQSVRDQAQAEAESRWLQQAPHIESDWDALQKTCNMSMRNLCALRLAEPGAQQPQDVLAAGVPWFMALFGRDTLITSYQALPVSQQLARGALEVLARSQGTQVVNFTDEEPGRIQHERRHDELTHFGDLPYSPYYGTIDATPLFLILLSEYWRWSGNRDFIHRMRAPARRALEWIDRYGDRDGDGFVEYETRSSHGLKNQGWKDSQDAITFHDGTLAEPPIALCEVQGYVYDARLRTAELADQVWEAPELARRLRDQAATLKRRFNEAFWLEGRQFFALALDRNKRPVDSVTSNAGQLLWSGIIDDDRARAVVRGLMDDAMFSGWGVRTLSQDCRRFNPIGYHIGTVWPHDNAIIAAGMVRHGFREEANRIAGGIVAAAPYSDYTLPEVFAGFVREKGSFPVRYPTSSSPQAWAAGAPLLMLRTMLGLEPDPSSRTLRVDPLLPKPYRRLVLRGIHAFGQQFDVVVEGDRAEVCPARRGAHH